MSNCIFCKIINKEIPGKIIYEDDVCIAFLDLSQATYGHTLVIPKKHFENILEVDAQTLAHVMQVTQKLAKLIVEKLNAKGLNILTNTNEVAGQTVHHFHVHILPRYDEKELVIEFNDHSQDVGLPLPPRIVNFIFSRFTIVKQQRGLPGYRRPPLSVEKASQSLRPQVRIKF